MKKLFVAVALVAGLGTSVSFANDTTRANMETVVLADDYTLIELKDVPQAIQDAVAKNYANYTIKEAHVKADKNGVNTYKLILINADQSEIIVLFNEAGEEVKEAANQ